MESTLSTTPPRLATSAAPESRATIPSMPVPTSGASVRNNGTACRCMFEPIRARLASSCSRKGMSAAATLTSWVGDTSIKSTWAGSTITNSPPRRADTRVLTKLPSSSTGALAWAIVRLSSSRADR